MDGAGMGMGVVGDIENEGMDHFSISTAVAVK
jgi:hypothetical protein